MVGFTSLEQEDSPGNAPRLIRFHSFGMKIEHVEPFD